jgi:hypothetical protein
MKILSRKPGTMWERDLEGRKAGSMQEKGNWKVGDMKGGAERACWRVQGRAKSRRPRHRVAHMRVAKPDEHADGDDD